MRQILFIRISDEYSEMKPEKYIIVIFKEFYDKCVFGLSSVMIIIIHFVRR